MMHAMLLSAAPGLMLSPNAASGALRMGAPAMQIASPAGIASANAGMAGGVYPVQGDSAILVQGGSLRTWSSRGQVQDHHVTLGTDGRPLDANVELWDGPGNTPVQMQVYGEDGYARPVRAVIRGGSRWRPQGGQGWYQPSPASLDEHNTLLLMSDGMDRSGGIGFRCVADAATGTETDTANATHV